MERNIYKVRPLREGDARDILSWRYSFPYQFYDPPQSNSQDLLIAQFLDPALNFHAVVQENLGFIGFCSFGLDGRVPGGNYSEPALDIGLGMKPELTGQGRGTAFFRSIMLHCESFVPAKRRLTVATFNERAIRLYRRFDFVEVERFRESLSDVEYAIMVREN